MLPSMKKNKDGSLTLFIQKDSPGKANESNWLPAPNGTIYLVMRLYWPKTTPPSILPAGEGTWNPPAVLQVQQAKPRPCHCCPRSEAATGAALDFAERAKQGGERLSPLAEFVEAGCEPRLSGVSCPP